MPWLRGTISYQALARARSRSASSGITALRVRSGRVSVCFHRGREHVVEQDGRDRCVVGELARAAVRRCGAARASRGISSAMSSWPSRAASETSCPASLLEQEFLAPGGELIGPGFDREQVPARRRRREAAVPAVVA